MKTPLELPYDNNITLHDVIDLAGGLTFAGDSNEVVVYRMPFEGDDIGQVKEIVLNMARDADFTFNPYDAIVLDGNLDLNFKNLFTKGGGCLSWSIRHTPRRKSS